MGSSTCTLCDVMPARAGKLYPRLAGGSLRGLVHSVHNSIRTAPLCPRTYCSSAFRESNCRSPIGLQTQHYCHTVIALLALGHRFEERHNRLLLPLVFELAAVIHKPSRYLCRTSRALAPTLCPSNDARINACHEPQATYFRLRFLMHSAFRTGGLDRPFLSVMSSRLLLFLDSSRRDSLAFFQCLAIH